MSTLSMEPLEGLRVLPSKIGKVIFENEKLVYEINFLCVCVCVCLSSEPSITAL